MNGTWISLAARISLGGLQLSWFAPLLLVLNRRVAEDSLPWPGILLFYPLAAALSGALRPRIRRGKYLLLAHLLLGFSALGVLAGFFAGGAPAAEPHSLSAAAARFFNPRQPDFFLLIASASAWGLGARLALLQISFRGLLGEFQFGLALLFFALFAEHNLEMDLPHLVPLALLFFFFALFGAGIAHGQERAGWTANRFFGTWIGFLLFSVALVLAAGLALAVLANPAFLQFLFSLLYRGGELLLTLLGRLLRLLMSLLPAPEPAFPPPPLPSPPAPMPEDWSPFFLISEATREILRILWTLMVVSVLLVALWRISSQIMGWLLRKAAWADGEGAEPLPGAFRADLRLFILWMLKTLSPRRLFRFLTRGKRPPAHSASLRQVYIRMLQWAAARGCRRGLAQTPFDFLPRLGEFQPEARDDFAAITGHYVRFRYGPSSPEAEMIREVNRRWENIRQTERRGRRIRRKKKGDPIHERNET